ncbi:MAG TPA: glycosyltransferase N-terminal domain-containing protein [Bacteroidia bacterium]|nr:glycosyltransferase N-terminal domain-containing protein [Bacteroidia bacterium]
MRFLYSAGIFFFGILIRFALLFNGKARKWVDGRKNILAEIEKKLSANTSPVAWFHCASLGEFEQGRPLIEAFRKENPGYFILLTFFSPSGFDVRKNYTGADFVCYLPLDTKKNARRFIASAKPSVAFFIKYEFWLNYLDELAQKNIPHFLVSAVFRNDQVFFRPWGRIFFRALQDYTWIFTQNADSDALLKNNRLANSSVAGDTRFDRVIEIASAEKDIPVAAAFSSNSNVIVAGSTWPQDEMLLLPCLAEDLRHGTWKLIIAPHELSEEHCAEIEKKLSDNGIVPQKIVRFSMAGNDIAEKQVLLIDNIGMLSSLYRYGKIAYIGGGFGAGIHNTLEAAVYGIPVLFGPNYEKFSEAKILLARGGGFSFSSAAEIKTRLDALMNDETARAAAGKNAGIFVQENKGATEKILSSCRGKINR